MPNSKPDNKKLGRGLEEILQQEKTLQQQLEFIQKDMSRHKVYVETAKLVPNPFQLPKLYTSQQLAELALSLKENGFVLPVLVRQRKGQYEIISGEKRWRAASEAQLYEIPVIVEDFSDEMMQQISIIEQIQRDDIHPLEEAFSYKRLIEKHGYSQQEVARQIGKSRVYVTNLIRITTLPSFVLDAVRNNQISISHARNLIGLEAPAAQAMLEQIVEQKLSVRQCEKLLQKNDTTPQIRISKKHITIRYHSPEQLEKILKKIQ